MQTSRCYKKTYACKNIHWYAFTNVRFNQGPHLPSRCAGGVRWAVWSRQTPLLNKRFNISGAFLSTHLLCLDSTMTSTACLFYRLRSQSLVKAIVLRWHWINPLWERKGRTSPAWWDWWNPLPQIFYLCSQGVHPFPAKISSLIRPRQGPETEGKTQLRVFSF